jgi:hypothetical protein
MAGLKWVGGGQEGEGMVGCSDRSRMRGEGERSLGSVYVGLLGLDLVCKDRLLKSPPLKIYSILRGWPLKRFPTVK